MRRLIIPVLMMSLVACGNGGNSTEVKLDSMGRKFDSSAERKWDSTKQKARDIKETIESKLEVKDSVHKKADTQ
jgi:hypothetical protein